MLSVSSGGRYHLILAQTGQSALSAEEQTCSEYTTSEHQNTLTALPPQPHGKMEGGKSKIAKTGQWTILTPGCHYRVANRHRR